ncbi:hypothetical protein FB451DRAFT_1177953 [Mycena latifolia]|nr:hypothetical protein FB451DRAFT_1177953 [Mycena latifolia]
MCICSNREITRFPPARARGMSLVSQSSCKWSVDSHETSALPRIKGGRWSGEPTFLFHGVKAVRAARPSEACRLRGIGESLDINAGETQDSKESQKIGRLGEFLVNRSSRVSTWGTRRGFPLSVKAFGDTMSQGQCNTTSCKGHMTIYNALESISEVWVLRLGRGEPNAVDFGEHPNVESRVA